MRKCHPPIANLSTRAEIVRQNFAVGYVISGCFRRARPGCNAIFAFPPSSLFSVNLRCRPMGNCPERGSSQRPRQSGRRLQPGPATARENQTGDAGKGIDDHSGELVNPTIAFRIGEEIFSQASATLSKSASAAASRRQLMSPICSACAARHISHLTQSHINSVFASQLPRAINPIGSRSRAFARPREPRGLSPRFQRRTYSEHQNIVFASD